jgi:predicted transcriptional regulator
MSALKESIVNMVKGLPDNVSLDEVMAELYFKAQVDAGLNELDEGKGISHEDVEKRMAKWLTA